MGPENPKDYYNWTYPVSSQVTKLGKINMFLLFPKIKRGGGVVALEDANPNFSNPNPNLKQTIKNKKLI